jgi:hypothetical protein
LAKAPSPRTKAAKSLTRFGTSDGTPIISRNSVQGYLRSKMQFIT